MFSVNYHNIHRDHLNLQHSSPSSWVCCQVLDFSQILSRVLSDSWATLSNVSLCCDSCMNWLESFIHDSVKRQAANILQVPFKSAQCFTFWEVSLFIRPLKTHFRSRLLYNLCLSVLMSLICVYFWLLPFLIYSYYQPLLGCYFSSWLFLNVVLLSV